MRFIDLQGREHNKSIDKYKYATRTISKSRGQRELGENLEALFPRLTILEEFPCFGTRLTLDYYLPTLGIAFEFDGIQHEEYNEFFHGGNRSNFAKGQMNDVKKDQWCIGNTIKLIRITAQNIHRLQEIIYERTRE